MITPIQVTPLPTKAWIDKDTFGTVHIMVQHEGMEPFDLIQIQYNYLYTSNSHQDSLAKQIIELLGYPYERKN